MSTSVKEIRELEKRYDNTHRLIDAVDKTIKNPTLSVSDVLAQGDKKDKKIAAGLVASGATIGTVGLASISGEIAALSAALGAGAIATGAGLTGVALGGPIAWGGAALAALVTWLIVKATKNKRIKKEATEKENLLKKIIQKQQAIIDKLNKQNLENQEEIRNLKEALRMMQEAETQVRANFAA